MFRHFVYACAAASVAALAFVWLVSMYLAVAPRSPLKFTSRWQTFMQTAPVSDNIEDRRHGCVTLFRECLPSSGEINAEGK